MEKVAVPPKKSVMIQNEFTEVCAQLGDCMAKIRRLEQVQDKLNAAYLSAIEEEKLVEKDEAPHDTVTTEATEQN